MIKSTLYFFGIVVFFISTLHSQAQCPTNFNYNYSPKNGCSPLPVSVSTNANQNEIQTLEWDFGDGDKSNNINTTHIYTNAGVYVLKLRIAYNNGEICEKIDTVRVNHNPTADFEAGTNNNVVVCGQSGEVCFKNKSRKSLNNSGLRSYFWTFGDGSSSVQENPCKFYNALGDYDVILEVTDSNGCKSNLTKRITVAKSPTADSLIQPKFSTELKQDCVTGFVEGIFKFIKDSTRLSSYNDIAFVEYDFGDGNKFSCEIGVDCLPNILEEIKHSYTKEGTYFAKIKIKDKYGCESFFNSTDPINVRKYDFFVNINPSGFQCWTGSPINYQMIAPGSPFAIYYIWDLGDPFFRSAGRTRIIDYGYNRPGTYNVHFRTKIGDCEYDTIICKAVQIAGVVAKISPDGRARNGYWDSIPDGLYKPVEKNTFFDTCSSEPIKYFSIDTTIISVPSYDFCNRDSAPLVLPYLTCQGDTIDSSFVILKPRVTGSKDSIRVSVSRNFWNPGSAVPSGLVYKDTFKANNPLRLDDTTIFNRSCTVPYTITFPNYSIKDRGYFATDNYPDSPGACINPSYPYASDSLEFSWDFKEGSNTQETDNNPNPLARYSNRKIPTHTFTKEGCYWVVLTVEDRTTGCIDYDSIPVIVQPANGKPDAIYNNIEMTWEKQIELPIGIPRRGLIIGGLPCVDDQQFLNINEIEPACMFKEMYLITDSANQIKGFDCNNKPIFNWKKLSFKEAKSYTFSYNIPGNKTIGAIIKNNDRCIDTVWYHNYKAINSYNAKLRYDTVSSLCLGDTLKLKILDTFQQGVSYVAFRASIVNENGDTLIRYNNDTLPYVEINNQKITSSIDSINWGRIDTFSINNLSKLIEFPLNENGLLVVKTILKSRYGCIIENVENFVVGHKTAFVTSKRSVCDGGIVEFVAENSYYKSNGKGVDTTLSSYWRNPIGARNFAKDTLDKLEKIYWDFENDGFIDDSGYFVTKTYNNLGVYDVAMITTDSTGCTQKLVKNNWISVFEIDGTIAIDTPGAVQYCAPKFYTFRSTYGLRPDSVKDVKLYQTRWEFGDGNSLLISDTTIKQVSHLYRRNGKFDVKKTLYYRDINDSTQKCEKTIVSPIEIVGPDPRFEIIGDSSGCVPFVLTLRDLTTKGNIREYRLGDGTVVSIPPTDTVRLIYNTPGTFKPSLYVADTIRDQTDSVLFCSNSFDDFIVTVFPIDTLRLLVSDSVLCAGIDVANFYDRKAKGYDYYHIDFGDGNADSNSTANFFHTYSEAGNYNVTLTGFGGTCPDTSSLSVRVTDVKAGFELIESLNDTPSLTFKNTSSLNAIRFEWLVKDNTPKYLTSSFTNYTHTFNKTGWVEVCLKAFNKENCVDEFCDSVEIRKYLFIPNIFTPDKDAKSLNELFHIDIAGELKYNLIIYNRWGDVVFTSGAKNNKWNGKVNNVGEDVPDGFYYFVFNYQFIGENEEKVTGMVKVQR